MRVSWLGFSCGSVAVRLRDAGSIRRARAGRRLVKGGGPPLPLGRNIAGPRQLYRLERNQDALSQIIIQTQENFSEEISFLRRRSIMKYIRRLVQIWADEGDLCESRRSLGSSKLSEVDISRTVVRIVLSWADRLRSADHLGRTG